MSYLAPSEFVTKMVDAGESKIFMSTRDTVIRAYMAGAILALAAWFAVTINVNTGQPLVGALLFPVGFVMLYLLGFDLLTGVFVLLCPENLPECANGRFSQNRPSLDLSPFVLKGLEPVGERGTDPVVFLNPNSCMGFEPEPSKEGSR